MFSRRPSKHVVSDETGGEQEIGVRMPQGVHIERCREMTFTIPNKVASITILDCDSIQVHLDAVISGVELIRCRHVTIHVTHTCHTFTIDDSTACHIHFPSNESQLQWISTGASGIVLHACESDGRVVREFTVDDASLSVHTDPNELDRNSGSALTQYRTVYKADGGFTSAPLEREGNIGQTI